jgi:hypothetical protein
MTPELTNPTVRGAITALQDGNRDAWSALFEPDAKLYDDGRPRDFRTYYKFQLSPSGKIKRLDIGQAK